MTSITLSHYTIFEKTNGKWRTSSKLAKEDLQEFLRKRPGGLKQKGLKLRPHYTRTR